MSDLYDIDIALWAKTQAELLRLRAEGKLVNEAELDWSNIAEEIESVGNEQRFAIESLLTNIMRHQLQIAAWPQVLAVQHWQHEIVGRRVQVRRRLQRNPGLRPIIEAELADLYRDAIETMYREVDGIQRPTVPTECPFTLKGLLTPAA